MKVPPFAIDAGGAAIVIGALLHAAMAPVPTAAKPTSAHLTLPRTFEVNEGQTDPRFDFVSRMDGSPLWISPTEVMLPQLRMQLVGANPSATKVALNRVPGRVHYFRGRAPSRWRRHVAAYTAVEYKNVYRGVDLVYCWKDGQLKWSFIVAPGVDPTVIVLRFDGVGRLQIDDHGDLVLGTMVEGAVRSPAPFVYQERKGVHSLVGGAYVLSADHRVRLQIGAYDATRPLVIDPVFVFSTRLGTGDHGYSIALDKAGNIYVTGDAASVDLPRTRPRLGTLGGSSDVFVTKLTPHGELIYSTFLGGRGADVGYGIAVDTAGNAYVTGDTNSPDFPVVAPAQRVLGGTSDVFVSKLSADGSQLLYSTYVGGSGGERGFGVAVDAAGAAYVAGYTNSRDFPTVHPIQGAFGGSDADAFVFKLTPNGSALAYSTYLGGRRPDFATSIAIDSTGSAYVTGFTNSVDFPTVKPIQPFRGPTDAFVSKLNPSGSALVYSTHLGGRADDEGQGIAVDRAGNAYVAGHTESPDFPTTAGAYSTKCVSVPVKIAIGDICSGGDAFITKINADGSAMVYSTYINGGRFESGRSIAVDSTGSAYMTGFTGSSDFITVNPPQKTFGGGGLDAFVVKLNPTGSALSYATYLGGSGEDGGYGIAVDPAGNAYVTGFTESIDFPSRHSLPRSSRGKMLDAFITRISP